MEYDAFDAVLHHIFKQTQGEAWYKPAGDAAGTGVCLRTGARTFRVFPASARLDCFSAAVAQLNPEVAVKVRTASVHAALATAKLDQTVLFVDAENRIQILRTISELARAEKGQGAAFIRDERILVVWSDRVDDIVAEVKSFDKLLLDLVWQKRLGSGRDSLSSSASSVAGSRPGSGTASLRGLTVDLPSPGLPPSPLSRAFPADAQDPEKVAPEVAEKAESAPEPAEDLEKGVRPKNARPPRLFAPVYNGLATAFSLYFVGTGINKLITAWALDGSFIRFALVLTLPLLFCISLFFCLTFVTNFAFVLGPVAQYHENSKYYSAIAPLPPHRGPLDPPEQLPHITIQMPVFKESLEHTITPSIDSLQRAMLTYARQGGTSSIFVNDDGMQVIPPADRRARQAFYENRGIGWAARPKHGTDGFCRAGRFKKASNMNFCLALALRMEEILVELVDAANAADDASDPAAASPSPPEAQFSRPTSTDGPIAEPLTLAEELARLDPDARADEAQLAERALARACAETGGIAWARGAKAMKMGSIILIVDSDTQVPEDCLRDAARELAESPEVAIIQHVSDAMQVAHHYFENAISYFTRRINHAISVACANGEIAPFVGHNAFLRWSAVQEAAFTDPADGKRKFWSEAHVSEDFDMALRLQLQGYTIRWATYSRGGFKEGVSLTIDDELNRWQKYAYGCSELLFHPFRQWVFKGPVTAQFRKFVWSPVPIHYKISVMAYMFSYYAIASALMLSTLNYGLLGFQLRVEDFYSHSWELWMACSVVFLGAGNVGFSILEYRLGQKNLIDAFVQNVKWLPFFFFFFGGLSFHLSWAMIAHLIGYNITWSSTVKEVEASNFFKEIPRIFRRFWGTFAACFVLIAAMVVLSTTLVPRGFQVNQTGWSVIFPLALQTGCHVLFPIVLNPWLMVFSY